MKKKKKQNREQKKEIKNTWKKNEVCLLSPNFKPV
jgi:hypothetical protein